MVFDGTVLERAATAISGITVALIGAAMALKKTSTKMTEESVAKARAKSELGVIELLHEELQRLAEQRLADQKASDERREMLVKLNDELATEINDLRKAVHQLNDEIQELRNENRSLKALLDERLVRAHDGL